MHAMIYTRRSKCPKSIIDKTIVLKKKRFEEKGEKIEPRGSCEKNRMPGMMIMMI